MKKIEELYAFVVVDDEGNEGIPAFSNGAMMLPLVGADMDRVSSLMEIAQDMANASRKQMQIRRFRRWGEQIGEVNPQ